MPLDKLYVRVRCSICKGTGMYSAGGTHDPMNPLKWNTCPHCDDSGLVIIEAADNVLADFINSLDEVRKFALVGKISKRKK
jgi:hypothetical protein